MTVSTPLRIIMSFVGLVIVVAGIWLYLVFYGSNDFAGANEKVFFVSRGETVTSVVDSLDAQGIIRNKAWFVFVIRMH